jgi:hypothetical protein
MERVATKQATRMTGILCWKMYAAQDEVRRKMRCMDRALVHGQASGRARMEATHAVPQAQARRDVTTLVADDRR